MCDSISAITSASKIAESSVVRVGDRVPDMTISLTEVGVLATIMPIGLLIIGFEVRSIPPFVATGRSGTFLLWYTGAALMLSMGLGFWAETVLVSALIGGRDVSGFDVTIVQLGFWLVGMLSFLLLIGSLSFALGIPDRLARRALARTAKSPRRMAQQIAYVEKHHPSAGPADDR